MKKKKYILIVGSSGFIGSFVAKEAISRGYNTIAGIRSSSSRKHLDSNVIHIVEFTHGNTQKLTIELKNLFESKNKPNYIIYNAGITKAINTESFHKVNYINLKVFIKCLIQLKFIPDKFLYISSLSAMGAGDEVNYTPLSIIDTPNPRSEYGKSKLKAEKLIETQNDIPYIILRPTGVYGPLEKDYLLMAKTINTGLNLKVGFKKQLLSFLHVKDLSNAIFLALESNIENETYIVSDGKAYTDNEYTQILKNILGKKRTLNLRIPLFILKLISTCSQIIAKLTSKATTLNRDKYIIMKQRNWACDITPIVTDLKFIPKYDLKKGMKSTIEWYKNEGWL